MAENMRTSSAVPPRSTLLARAAAEAGHYAPVKAISLSAKISGPHGVMLEAGFRYSNLAPAGSDLVTAYIDTIHAALQAAGGSTADGSLTRAEINAIQRSAIQGILALFTGNDQTPVTEAGYSIELHVDGAKQIEMTAGQKKKNQEVQSHRGSQDVPSHQVQSHQDVQSHQEAQSRRGNQEQSPRGTREQSPRGDRENTPLDSQRDINSGL
jgi:hypothetical protein